MNETFVFSITTVVSFIPICWSFTTQGMAFRRLVTLLLWGWTLMAGSDGKLSCVSPQFLEFGEEATIKCSPIDEFFGVFWYNSREYKTDLPVLFYQESEIKGIGYDKGEYDIYPNGSLIIRKVSVQHDRYFTVAYLRSRENTDTEYYEIKCVVIVRPVPFYPVVEGCNGRQYCTLVVNMEGNLTCSLSGIRPKVQLVWANDHEEASPVVSWLSSTTTVEENDVSYNISLTSLFKFTTTQYFRTAPVECRTNGTYQKNFDLVSRVELILNVDHTPGESNSTQMGDQVPSSHTTMIVGIVLPVTLMSVLFGLYIILKGFRKKQLTSPNNKEEMEKDGRELTKDSAGKALLTNQCDKEAITEEDIKQKPPSYQDHLRKIAEEKSTTNRSDILKPKHMSLMEKDGRELTEDGIGKTLLANKCDREAMTEEDIKQKPPSYQEHLRKHKEGKSTTNRSDISKTKYELVV